MPTCCWAGSIPTCSWVERGKPDMRAVAGAFAGLRKHLGGDLKDVARGVVRIANANMVNALKLVSLNRGATRGTSPWWAFGGGGRHARRRAG